MGRGTARLDVRVLDEMRVDRAWSKGARIGHLLEETDRGVAVRETTPSMRQQSWKAQVSGCRTIHHR